MNGHKRIIGRYLHLAHCLTRNLGGGNISKNSLDFIFYKNCNDLSEFSTIDTTELVLGALFAGNYFGGEVENLALQLRDATQWSDAIKLIEILSLYLMYFLLYLDRRTIPEYTLPLTPTLEL